MIRAPVDQSINIAAVVCLAQRSNYLTVQRIRRVTELRVTLCTQYLRVEKMLLVVRTPLFTRSPLSFIHYHLSTETILLQGTYYLLVFTFYLLKKAFLALPVS